MIEVRLLRRWMFSAVTCGWVALSSLAVHAEDFSVGRTEVEFSEQGWKEVTLPDRSESYGVQHERALAVEAKLYVHDNPDSGGQVLVLVSANSTGMGAGRTAHMRYSPDCRSDEEVYREGNEGINTTFAQCLMVTPLYNNESVFKALAPQVLNLQASGEVVVQRPVYTVLSRHAISTGSFLDVRVFATSPIGANTESLTDALPKGVLPELVAWGRQLKDAVKSSVYSLSGRLVVPAIRLVPQPLNPATNRG